MLAIAIASRMAEEQTQLHSSSAWDRAPAVCGHPVVVYRACHPRLITQDGAAILCTVQTAAEPDVFGSEKPTIGCVRDMDLKSKVNKCSPTGSPRFGSQTCSELLKMKTTGENSCY